MSLSQYLGAHAEGWKENQWFGGTIVSISQEEGKVIIVLGKTQIWKNREWSPVSDEQIALEIPVQTVGDPDTNGMLVIGVPSEHNSSAILFKRGHLPLSRDLSDLLFSSN